MSDEIGKSLMKCVETCTMSNRVGHDLLMIHLVQLINEKLCGNENRLFNFLSHSKKLCNII